MILGQINLSTDAERLRQQLHALLNKIDAEFSRISSRGEAVWDAPNIAIGGTTTTTITAAGARAGDAVRVFHPVSLQGMVCSAYVSADDVVTVVLYNPTGGGVDLASGTWRVAVEHY